MCVCARMRVACVWTCLAVRCYGHACVRPLLVQASMLCAPASASLSAGEWAAAMIVAVCQGNVQGVYAISQKVSAAATAGGGPPTAEAQSAAQLAAALRSVYGGAGTLVHDMELRLVGSDPGGEDAVGACILCGARGLHGSIRQVHVSPLPPLPSARRWAPGAGRWLGAGGGRGGACGCGRPWQAACTGGHAAGQSPHLCA